MQCQPGERRSDDALCTSCAISRFHVQGPHRSERFWRRTYLEYRGWGSGWGEAPKTDGEAAHVETNGWGTPSHTDSQTAASATPSAWGGTSAWGTDTTVNGSTTPSVKSQPIAQPKPSKTPATSKMSWAQIARASEKPVPPPQPAPQPAPPAPAPVSAPAPAREPTPPAPEPEHVSEQQGWEEPTTAQPPSWDDEPQSKPSITATEPWATSAEAQPVEETKPAAEEPAAPAEPEPVAAPAPAAPSQPQPTKEQEALPESIPKPFAAVPAVQLRPSSAAHRHSARFKTTDSPVILPSHFGTGVEKIGMQFGSLSLGGDDVVDTKSNEPAPAKEQALPAESPVAPEPQQPVQLPSAPVQPQAQEPVPAPSTSPSIQNSLNTAPSFISQGIPQQAQPPVSQHIPTSISQPSIQTQVPPHQAPPASSSISPFPHQTQQQQAVSPPSLAGHHQPLQAQTAQSQSQLPTSQHHQYAQHGLPTHLDPQSQVQHSPHLAQAAQPQSAHSSYFRQPEAPYFHAATPPAGQAQESPADYGYGDNQRNLYDSYGQQTGFGNRGVLDDVKGLPGLQQQASASAGLPPNSAQASQQHPQSAQGNAQPQPAGNQGPQQGYPPPMPYYNPYPQNQYYGSPYNYAYGVPQPFVKYPTMFQPGPPGPGSAPSPAAKQGPSAVNPQTNPYSQGLYGQQHPSASYDDISYHPQHGHGQSVSGNLPANEYSKQLYGGHAAQGMQGFMNLGPSSGPNSGAPIGQRAGGASPENAYKPYAPGVKDVGTGVGVGVGQGGVNQPQGRAGVQQPQHGQSGFYGGARFNSGAGACRRDSSLSSTSRRRRVLRPTLGTPRMARMEASTRTSRVASRVATGSKGIVLTLGRRVPHSSPPSLPLHHRTRTPLT
ncbi:hypothetical protein EVG20_g8922 [Dentipellis fragilis]|uniref:Uncharacterized protein n=1 Tax=Dentipellis fragilis TaxID=205917 RepID=A0A4Y9Y3D5_9AGAM|nr:hypothetical protein EVG20_g8922 [Dentipellis fragilis]